MSDLPNPREFKDPELFLEALRERYPLKKRRERRFMRTEDGDLILTARGGLRKESFYRELHEWTAPNGARYRSPSPLILWRREEAEG